MLPYGKNNKFRMNFRDCHPKKLGRQMRNWWEVELGGVDKGAERQRAKREIKKQINEQQSD
jgi:hypothetical protein